MGSKSWRRPTSYMASCKRELWKPSREKSICVHALIYIWSVSLMLSLISLTHIPHWYFAKVKNFISRNNLKVVIDSLFQAVHTLCGLWSITHILIDCLFSGWSGVPWQLDIWMNLVQGKGSAHEINKWTVNWYCSTRHIVYS